IFVPLVRVPTWHGERPNPILGEQPLPCEFTAVRQHSEQARKGGRVCDDGARRVPNVWMIEVLGDRSNRARRCGFPQRRRGPTKFSDKLGNSIILTVRESEP